VSRPYKRFEPFPVREMVEEAILVRLGQTGFAVRRNLYLYDAASPEPRYVVRVSGHDHTVRGYPGDPHISWGVTRDLPVKVERLQDMNEYLGDEVLRRAPELQNIEQALAEAYRQLQQLRDRSGRDVAFMVDDGVIHVIDAERRKNLRALGQVFNRPLAAGGAVVRTMMRAGLRWLGMT
jgi:hypothetical protein